MVDDKDLHTVIRMLPKEATFYWTQPSTKRAFPVKKIAEEAKEYGLDGNCYKTVKDAYMTALKDAGEEDFIFVGGSSYIVADLLSKKI